MEHGEAPKNILKKKKILCIILKNYQVYFINLKKKKKKKSLTRYNYLFIFWFYRKYKVVLYSFKYSHNLICDKFYILNT